ncbi:MAG: nucleoside deaminase [Propioniciclava sp.]|uniref:nucleoside deaminase n=1 Tax=Propioniciclava sp. TaxID=2038686 RepID=UPI0039E366F8
MRLALDQARAAFAHGDVPIGAVVLDAGGVVLARAGNERELTGDPTAHAEVLALRRAASARAAEDRGWSFEDCTLVVTLEPCAMCAGALVNARIGRLVFGAFDAKAGAVASVFDIVRDPRLNHRVEVIAGVEADACAALLREFFAGHR